MGNDVSMAFSGLGYELMVRVAPCRFQTVNGYPSDEVREEKVEVMGHFTHLEVVYSVRCNAGRMVDPDGFRHPVSPLYSPMSGSGLTKKNGLPLSRATATYGKFLEIAIGLVGEFEKEYPAWGNLSVALGFQERARYFADEASLLDSLSDKARASESRLLERAEVAHTVWAASLLSQHP